LISLTQYAFTQGELAGNTGFFPPDSVRRPFRDELVRLPTDVIIGELGMGAAPSGAYLFAKDFMESLIHQNDTAPIFSGVDNALLYFLFEEIEFLEPYAFRLGGGRFEPDGAVSFLVRFIGREKSMTGEMYLMEQSNEDGSVSWLLDDFIVEESIDIIELRESYRFNFSTYERLH
jgi:hypothetical protein